jgi:hypothetical protein
MIPYPSMWQCGKCFSQFRDFDKAILCCTEGHKEGEGLE